jgi:hypothetical protein
MRRSLQLLFAIFMVSGSVVACDVHIVDPSLSPVTEPFTPPLVYRKWYAQTEACSGVKGDFDKINWYHTPETTLFVSGENATAYWSAGSNRIVLTRNVELDGQIVRHEMLHSLVRGKGHPREQFLGKCRGWVHCENGCVPEQDLSQFAAWKRLPPESLVVNVSLDPSQPSMAIDSGFFQVIVEVQNTQSQRVMVNMPAPSPGIPPNAFTVTFNGQVGSGLTESRPYLDYSAITFQPGETKREVFDHRIGETPRLRPGQYRIFGKYGSAQKGPINVTLPSS